MVLLFDVKAVAYDMLQRYGEDAVQEATKNADDAKTLNDLDLEETWTQFAKAAADLDSKLPKIPD